MFNTILKEKNKVGGMTLLMSRLTVIANFCSAKDNVKKMTWQAIDWEKILAKDISDKGLLSKMCKELLHLSNKKTNNLIFKMAQRRRRKKRKKKKKKKVLYLPRRQSKNSTSLCAVLGVEWGPRHKSMRFSLVLFFLNFPNKKANNTKTLSHLESNCDDDPV